jgi:hypothetical protein
LHGARYTGTPRIVATGEAAPEGDADEASKERAQAALEALQTAMHESDTRPAVEPAPATKMYTTPETPAPAERHSESWLVAESAEETPSAVPPSTAGGPDETRIRRVDAVPSAPEAAPSPPEAAADAGESAGLAATAAGEEHRDDRPAASGTWRKYRWALAAVLALVVVAIVVVAAGSGSKSKRTPAVLPGLRFATPLGAVPDNRVTATGNATIRLNGDMATVAVTTNGLLSGAAHAMHIHAGGMGQCPPASAARLHNGHLSIDTSNGGPFYGPPVVSLTTVGDTSRRSIIDFTRYPTTGNIRYKRTFAVPASVAAQIRRGNAVIVVHGIDYDGNGVYDDVLQRSDLSHKLPAEATDPALCGAVARAATTQTASSANAGGATVYSASLTVDASMSSPEGMFLCDITAAKDATVATAATAIAERRTEHA